jgi:predicted type IV restriction endonuclease
MPFISALGYDVFDPVEVIPEFTADVGIKKGEKVDYAIKQDGKIIMLFECKCCNGSLDDCHASQLYRYFSVTEARIAVLTDGIIYRFYTDIEQPNKMDPQTIYGVQYVGYSRALLSNRTETFNKTSFQP